MYRRRLRRTTRHTFPPGSPTPPSRASWCGASGERGAQCSAMRGPASPAAMQLHGLLAHPPTPTHRAQCGGPPSQGLQGQGPAAANAAACIMQLQASRWAQNCMHAHMQHSMEAEACLPAWPTVHFLAPSPAWPQGRARLGRKLGSLLCEQDGEASWQGGWVGEAGTRGSGLPKGWRYHRLLPTAGHA